MNYTDFIAEFKDSVLKILCEEVIPYRLVSFDYNQISPNKELLNVCLNQFQERGFITDFGFRGDIISLMLTAEALDFLNYGGFCFEEQILFQNLQKIQLELNELQANTTSESQIKKITNITSIITNLISTATTFIR